MQDIYARRTDILNFYSSSRGLKHAGFMNPCNKKALELSAHECDFIALSNSMQASTAQERQICYDFCPWIL